MCAEPIKCFNQWKKKNKGNGNKSREAVGILTCVSEKASGV